MSVVVVVDTARIQGYVFGSNRLRENLGASYLVAMATGEWALNAIGTSGGTPIYSGGGNTVAEFPDGASAGRFSRALSERVLEEAPGLRLLVEASDPQH